MSDWAPVNPGSKLLTRNMSYIKPLNGSLGPKQTKCEIKDETVHSDFETYISTVTTTRTPDVPSGGVFAVKTRTCIMWAGPISSKVVVTTQVEWTGRSFIKGACSAFSRVLFLGSGLSLVVFGIRVVKAIRCIGMERTPLSFIVPGRARIHIRDSCNFCLRSEMGRSSRLEGL